MSSLGGANVLITGGNGFIGSHLVKRLAGEGAAVHVLSRSDENIRGMENVIFHKADIRDYGVVKNAVNEAEPEKIFHLAAIVNVSREMKDMKPVMETKINGTLNLLNALDGTDYDCFINTGTCEEYGSNPPPFREDMPPRPISHYSAANASVTSICRMLYETNGLPILTLRQFTCYGPGQKTGMLIPYVISSALSGDDIRLTKGEQKRDFNYVDDAVESFMKASSEKRAIGEVINVGTGESRRIMDVVASILSITKSSAKPLFGAVPYRKPEIWEIRANITKAERILGWKPVTGMEDGLKKTVEWYRKSIPS